MIRLPWTSGGSVGGLGTSSSLKVMYRQQSVASLAAHRPEIGSGRTVGAPWATREGTTTAIVPTSTAETVASPSLRTTAHPLGGSEAMGSGRGSRARHLSSNGPFVPFPAAQRVDGLGRLTPREAGTAIPGAGRAR